MDRSKLWRVAAITVLGVAMFSCSSPQQSSAPAPATAPPGKTDTKGDGQLTLAEFTLEDAAGRPLSMTSDGAVTGPGGSWGRVHADGTITSADGSLRGKLSKAGVVTDASGTEVATIADDGSAKVGSLDLRFGDDGQLVGGNPKQPIKIKALTPEGRRAAMLVLVLVQLNPKP